MVSTRSSTRSTSAAGAANTNNNTNNTTASSSSSSTTSPTTSTTSPAAAMANAAFTNPASNSLEIDPVSKARTITHMNRDHRADLAAILRHRAGLTEAQAVDAEMLDLDLATLVIRANGAGSNHHVHTLALDPPLATWNDRRARLIDMTLEARQALGLAVSAEEEQHAAATTASSGPPPPHKIQWYPPEGADLVPFSVVLLDYLAALLVATGHLAPGTRLWSLLAQLGPWLPGGPAGFAWAVTTACPLFVAAHLVEMVWLDRTRLAPAGVPRGSKVWCLWLGGQLIDGFATLQRWDRRILGKGAKKGEKDL